MRKKICYEAIRYRLYNKMYDSVIVAFDMEVRYVLFIFRYVLVVSVTLSMQIFHIPFENNHDSLLRRKL